MSNLIQSMILLFILAIILGFVIGYLIRNNARKYKYMTEIEKLNETHDETEYLYNKSLQRDKDIQNKFSVTDEIYQTQLNLLHEKEEVLQVLHEKENTLLSEQKMLDTELKDKTQHIKNIEEEIQTISSKLEAINHDRTLLKQDKKEIATLENVLNEKTNIINKYEDDINTIKNERHSIKIETEQLEKTILNEKKILADTKTAMSKIKRKYDHKISDLTKLNENLKITAINYEYALKDHQSIDKQPVHQDAGLIKSLFALPATKEKEIEHFVKKSDQTRFIDKLFRKILKKPNLHIEEL